MASTTAPGPPPVKDLDRTPQPAINKITWAQWLFMRITYRIASLFLTISSWPYFTPRTQPSYLKPQLPYLRPTRIFLPPSFHSSPGRTYPLYVHIHGGGWYLGQPSMVDPLAKAVAARGDCVVASVDYRKTPSHPFPAAQHDLAAMIPQLVADAALRVQPKQVYLGGDSAGGNLALALSLAGSLPTLAHPIAGTAAIYPSCDLAEGLPAKLARRGGERDMLATVATMMLRAYVPVGEDLKNPRLSPLWYHRREDLPDRVYVLGAEKDMLYAEAQRLAERLAGDAPRVPYGDAGWRADNVIFEPALGQRHGFNSLRQKGPAEAKRLHLVECLYNSIAKLVKGE